METHEIKFQGVPKFVDKNKVRGNQVSAWYMNKCDLIQYL